MYFDTRTGRVNTDRISPADAYFSIRLAQIAWHAVPSILGGLVCALMLPAFLTWLVLTNYFGVDSTSAAGDSLGVAAVFWVLVCIRWRQKARARRAAQRRFASEWAPPGALKNPPAPWFSDDGKPLWVRTATGWVPAPSTVVPVAIAPEEPSLRATRSDRLIGR